MHHFYELQERSYHVGTTERGLRLKALNELGAWTPNPYWLTMHPKLYLYPWSVSRRLCSLPSVKQAKGSTAWPPLFPAASPVPKPSYAACNSTSSSHTAIPYSCGHLPPQAPRRIRAPHHACLSSFSISQREKSSVSQITHASSSLFPILYFDFSFSKIRGVATCWGLGCPPSLMHYEAASVGLLEGSQHLSKMKTVSS